MMHQKDCTTLFFFVQLMYTVEALVLDALGVKNKRPSPSINRQYLFGPPITHEGNTIWS